MNMPTRDHLGYLTVIVIDTPWPAVFQRGLKPGLRLLNGVVFF